MAKEFCANAFTGPVLNWDDLRFFLTVARGESLSAAAKTLRVDPGTVGRRIARLETSVGAALFTKTPQGYLLAEAGHRLLPHAERVESEIGGATDDLRNDASLSGTVRIGAPDGCANYLLPQVTRDLVAANPGLDVQVLALPRIVNLSRREADFAISVSRPSAGRLTVQKIADYRLHLAAHRDYLTANTPITCIGDLRAHRIVGYIPDMIFDRELDYLSELGMKGPSFASNAVSVQLNWLNSGAGIGIVHDFAMPFAPDLVRVLPDRIALTRTFWLVRHAEDRRVDRLTMLAEGIGDGLRREITRLEASTDAIA